MKIYSEEQIAQFEKISADTENLYSPYACKNAQAVRPYFSRRYEKEALRSQYSVDVDKIIHSPFFNRGSDKTQVFSFFKNDDITRRAAHVQLVSRIARTIGKALRLNLDLIEAIAIGHDIGHTPFGHKGEHFLNELYNKNTGRYFNHNVHSVRVLQTLSGCNLTLQTVDGILCHCGEKVNEKYEPNSLKTFEEFNALLEKCYTDEKVIGTLHPSTMEGCVVRVSDMIAYLGKDRQDAARLKMEIEYDDSVIGTSNSEIIFNVIGDIVSNSMGKPYLSLSEDVFEALKSCQKENNLKIYQIKEVTEQYEIVVKPMMEKLYYRFLEDIAKRDVNSLIFKSHILHKIYGSAYRDREKDKTLTDADLNNLENYRLDNPNDIVVDFIASMTDDYFLEAFRYLFPDDELNEKVKYTDYFG